MVQPARPFEVVAKYKPAGDQPQAIAGLIEGIDAGLAHQTLLGVTGSGKSDGHDDPLYLFRMKDRPSPGRDRSRGSVHRRSVGVDPRALTRNRHGKLPLYRRNLLHAGLRSCSRDVGARHRVAAFLRHRAPERMFRLTTRCGRRLTLTGDHNLWVLRSGKRALVRTDEVSSADWIPTPARIDGTENLEVLDVTEYFADSGLSVFAEEAIEHCIDRERS